LGRTGGPTELALRCWQSALKRTKLIAKDVTLNIDKEQILQLLQSQGHHDQAAQANTELPEKVDTDNNDHADLLAKFGLNPADIVSKLGGLGSISKLL
jgi:hypothetical protein